MAKPKFTPEQVAQALTECRGLVFLTAKKLGCSHDTVERMIKKHPACAAARVQQQGEMVDEGEGALWKAVRAGEAWAVCFLLKCKGKDRGYAEVVRQEISGPGGGPIRQETTADLNTLSDEQLERIVNGVYARAGGPGGDGTPEAPGSPQEPPGVHDVHQA